MAHFSPVPLWIATGHSPAFYTFSDENPNLLCRDAYSFDPVKEIVLDHEKLHSLARMFSELGVQTIDFWLAVMFNGAIAFEYNIVTGIKLFPYPLKLTQAETFPNAMFNLKPFRTLNIFYRLGEVRGESYTILDGRCTFILFFDLGKICYTKVFAECPTPAPLHEITVESLGKSCIINLDIPTFSFPPLQRTAPTNFAPLIDKKIQFVPVNQI
jgi:hypothetical protein